MSEREILNEINSLNGDDLIALGELKKQQQELKASFDKEMQRIQSEITKVFDRAHGRQGVVVSRIVGTAEERAARDKEIEAALRRGHESGRGLTTKELAIKFGKSRSWASLWICKRTETVGDIEEVRDGLMFYYKITTPAGNPEGRLPQVQSNVNAKK